MPRPSRRRAKRRKIQSDPITEYLISGVRPDGWDSFDAIYWDADVTQQAWNERRGEILQTFVATYPGQRPFAWWRFDAPELRQRVGGIGTPLPIKLIEWGVQRLWYWPSFAKAANERNECANDSVVAADLNDPPVFEGQGAYLRRLGLLLANETPLPKTLTPEAVEINHE